MLKLIESRYPYDEQTCDLKFSTPDFISKELTFEMLSGVSFARDDNSEWDVADPKDTTEEEARPLVKGERTLNEAQSKYSLSVTMKRHFEQPSLYVIFPTVLISVCPLL